MGSVLIAHDPVPGATAVTCYPEKYDELETVLVQADERNDPKYRAYYIGLPLADIADRFEMLEPLEPRPEGDRRDRPPHYHALTLPCTTSPCGLAGSGVAPRPRTSTADGLASGA